MGICLGSPAGNTRSASGKLFGAKVAPGTAKPETNAGVMLDPSLSSRLKSFAFNDLRNATRDFSADNLIGEGGFGLVFKGWINEQTLAPCRPGTGMAVVVKKLKSQSFQGHREWLAEVNYLGQLHQENLVTLIGYCAERNYRLLVYEFLPKGSLTNHLFKKGGQPMAWGARVQIALDIARGLAFLHSLDANIIYRDLKASNILIDSKFHAKLSDFGLARKGPSGEGTHVSTRVMGTMGYAAPEYLASGHLTTKSVVYSFGVVLLELLSGKPAMDAENFGGADGSLVEWAKPFIGDARQFSRIMDTRLRGEYSRKTAQATSSLAVRCLDNDPRNRPRMEDVLGELEHLQALQNSAQAKMQDHVRKLSSYKYLLSAVQ